MIVGPVLPHISARADSKDAFWSAIQIVVGNHGNLARKTDQKCLLW
jgi:hypothetical protein